ncbi:MAG: hypothetical protein FWC25_02425, partial [Dehalococcoidia bacterium]|nr:hypothetical protein [Dehalococcoidia bacterium]
SQIKIWHHMVFHGYTTTLYLSKLRPLSASVIYANTLLNRDRENHPYTSELLSFSENLAFYPQ